MRNKKIIVALTGGLGNQMFQYAFGRMLQERFGVDLEFDISFYRTHPERSVQIDKYNIANVTFKYHPIYSRLRLIFQRIPVLRWIVGTYKERREFVLDENIFTHRYSYYAGYWQNFRYFERIAGKLRQELEFKGSIPEVVKTLSDRMKNEDSIAVHIRRGDFLSEKYIDEFCTLNEEYYRSAIKFLSREGRPIYFFSNDIKWCKKTFGDINNSFFVDNSISISEHTDFYLMRSAQHLIMANSTFSWWAGEIAYSNNREVICPINWYVNQNINRKAKEALINPDWTIW